MLAQFFFVRQTSELIAGARGRDSRGLSAAKLPDSAVDLRKSDVVAGHAQLLLMSAGC